MRKSPRRDVPLRCPQSLGHLGALCALPSGRSGDHANSIGNQCEARANPGANVCPAAPGGKKTYLTELDAPNGVAIDVKWRRPHAHAHDVWHDEKNCTGHA